MKFLEIKEMGKKSVWFKADDVVSTYIDRNGDFWTVDFQLKGSDHTICIWFGEGKEEARKQLMNFVDTLNKEGSQGFIEIKDTSGVCRYYNTGHIDRIETIIDEETGEESTYLNMSDGTTRMLFWDNRNSKDYGGSAEFARDLLLKAGDTVKQVNEEEIEKEEGSQGEDIYSLVGNLFV